MVERSTSSAMTRENGLPGWEIVRAGLDDISSGRVTIAAALVQSASRALRRRGIPVPDSGAPDDIHLYRLVVASVGERRAHSRYNALRRRLSSFLRAAADARAG